ncbi:MAG: YggT family protein [Clostridia bacterium]|nr:YggT family protein [Clostridia bacterium]MBQ3869910.1 YggT family protein [Clostridia bacterium]
MSFILMLLSNTVYYILMATEAAILARVILGWIMPEDDSAVTVILWFITEPFLLPCRMLLDRFNVGGGMFDFSPVLASVLISLVMLIIH